MGEDIHGRNGLLAVETADFRAPRTGGDETGGLEQPTAHLGPRGHGPGLAGQEHEHRLGHVLRQGGVARLAQRCGMHPVEMPPYQLGEGCFRSSLGVLPQQFPVIHRVHGHSSIHPRRDEKRTGLRRSKLKGRSVALRVFEYECAARTDAVGPAGEIESLVRQIVDLASGLDGRRRASHLRPDFEATELPDPNRQEEERAQR